MSILRSIKTLKFHNYEISLCAIIILRIRFWYSMLVSHNHDIALDRHWLFTADKSWLHVSSCIKSQKTDYQGIENQRVIYQIPLLEQNISVGRAVNAGRTVDPNPFVTQLTLSDPTSDLVRRYDFPIPLRCRVKSDTFFFAFVHPLRCRSLSDTFFFCVCSPAPL